MSQLIEVLLQLIVVVVMAFFYKGHVALTYGNWIFALPLMGLWFFWGNTLEKIMNPKKKKVKVSIAMIAALIIWLVFRASLEELIFRVHLWAMLGKDFNLWIALAISSGIFSLLHSYEGWKGILGSFIHGMSWGVIFHFFGIVPAVISHASFNLGGYLRNVKSVRGNYRSPK